MATPAHDDSKKELLRKLREEPDAWNQWWTSLGPEKRRQSDLWGEDLRGADLKSRKLADANLSGSNLEDADLSYSDLTHARLPEANMRGARLFHLLSRLSGNTLFLHFNQAPACGKENGSCPPATRLADDQLV